MKYLNIALGLLMVAGLVSAAQKTTFTQREVRDPRKLQAALEANASDAETRIAAVEAVGASTTTVSLAASALQPNSVTFTNSVADTITNLVIVVEDGLVVSVTINDQATPSED